MKSTLNYYPLVTAWLSQLDSDDQEAVTSLHELGESLRLRVALVEQKDSFSLKYSLPVGPALFAIEATSTHWCVQVNLFHMDRYARVVADCSRQLRLKLPFQTPLPAYEQRSQPNTSKLGRGQSTWLSGLTNQEWDEVEKLLVLEKMVWASA